MNFVLFDWKLNELDKKVCTITIRITHTLIENMLTFFAGLEEGNPF